MKNVKPETIARTICFFLALLNQGLALFGKNKLEFAENDIYQIVSLLFTAITSVVAWWKNNSFTKNAIQADEVLAKLKGESDGDK